MKPLRFHKRQLAAAVLFALWVVLSASIVQAQTPAEAIVREQAERLPTGKLEQSWQQLMQEYGGYFPESKRPGFIDLMVGDGGFSPQTIFSALGKSLLHEVMLGGKLLAALVILTVFSIILETLQSAFERNTVSKLAYAVTYMVLLLIAIHSFSVAIGYAKAAIEQMIQFMIAIIPLMLTMLGAMGNVTSVAVLHPLIVFMIHTVGTVVYSFVFPLMFFSALLYIVSSINEKYKVTQLAALLRRISLATLGMMVTVFLGVISVQGGTGAVTDGVAIRTAKYITGNFVPVVGRLFSDASETVIGASLLVKNAVGLSGVILLLLLCAFPAMKIMALALIYNLSAAILQPLGANPITGCLQTIGKSLIYVFAALAAVSFMFFLAVTILITAGNVSVMMR